MSADREYLGRGWRFPVAINLTGGVSTSSYEENVRESMFILLGTAPGERLQRPDYGCRIHDLMFAPNNYITAARAEYYCQEAIYKFEPRVDSVEVVSRIPAEEPNRLDLVISYVIVGQNDKRNLVYPFYLRKPDEESK